MVNVKTLMGYGLEKGGTMKIDIDHYSSRRLPMSIAVKARWPATPIRIGPPKVLTLVSERIGGLAVLLRIGVPLIPRCLKLRFFKPKNHRRWNSKPFADVVAKPFREQPRILVRMLRPAVPVKVGGRIVVTARGNQRIERGSEISKATVQQ